MWETGVSLDAKGSDLSRFLAQVKNPANMNGLRSPLYVVFHWYFDTVTANKRRGGEIICHAFRYFGLCSSPLVS